MREDPFIPKDGAIAESTEEVSLEDTTQVPPAQPTSEIKQMAQTNADASQTSPSTPAEGTKTTEGTEVKAEEKKEEADPLENLDLNIEEISKTAETPASYVVSNDQVDDAINNIDVNKVENDEELEIVEI